ncbi:MCE family protein, partial [Nocardioides sp.]|uniref:MCE family protein n=1 Tax=Nocardioides sp. TaxID=35761 RepID=UPI0027353337
VPQSSVKVNDVAVGKVSDVRLDGYVAEVDVKIRRDVALPDNAIAEIRQTSLLGEKFVSLGAPAQPSSTPLEDGATIPLERSGRNPEVEEVLGALSLLLNGGGVAQLKTIAAELNLALEGREGSAKSVLTQIDSLMETLDENKDDIIDAIEALNRLSITVNGQTETIDAALNELPSALRSLDRQRADLVKMLQALNELGDVGTEVIRQSTEGTIKSLELLDPVLTQFAKSGDDFANAFSVFLTYPFVDEVVGRDPQVARNLHMGDYTNLSVQLDVDLRNGLPPVPGLPDECIQLGDIPQIGPLPPLEELCQKAAAAVQTCLQEQTVDACAGLPGAVINEVCKAGPIPLLCPSSGGGGSGGLLPGVPSLPGLGSSGSSGLLGGLLGGSARAPLGATSLDPARGPTMGQLMDSYDAALVSLLVPGMVTQ